MLTFLNNIDKTILFFIQNNLHFKVIDKIMILFTTMGNMGLIWIFISILLLINKKTRNIGIVSFLALFLSTILGEGVLKHIIQRPRPFVDFQSFHLLVPKPTSYSFPSGHTASSFSAAYVLGKKLKNFSLIFWLIAILIAFSRLYLFLHYPSDIIGGIILGLICGKIALYLYEQCIEDKLSNIAIK